MDHHDDRIPITCDPAGVSARIDELRNALRWSWGDLAAACGVTERTVIRWRNGEALPLVGAVRGAAEAMGVTYEEITYGLERPGDVSDAPESEPPRSRHAA
jgi:transcriptional regulator with XRE-family HTH domain